MLPRSLTAALFLVLAATLPGVACGLLVSIGPDDPRAPSLLEYMTQPPGGTDPEAHRRLAHWCDDHGLWDQATSHWERVLSLAPMDPSARRRLGYRRDASGWVLDREDAERVAQEEATRFWKERLTALHRRMHVQEST